MAESRVDTEGWLAKARKPVLVSDEEEEGSENEYEMGSFVCDDEEVDFACEFGPEHLHARRTGSVVVMCRVRKACWAE